MSEFNKKNLNPLGCNSINSKTFINTDKRQRLQLGFEILLLDKCV